MAVDARAFTQKAKTMFNNVRSKIFKAAYNPLAEKTIKEPLAAPTAEQKGPKLPEPADVPREPVKEFFNSFLKTFLGLLIPALIFFICTLAGSIAANDAIGRHWAVRLVYFFYGSFPLFSPLVAIYYIYRYYIDTYPVWYNFIPLTTTVYDNSFMRLITKPFYYSDDANIQYMHKKFLDSATPFILGAAASNSKESKPSNNSSSSSSSNGNGNGNGNNINNVSAARSREANINVSSSTGTNRPADRRLNNGGETANTGTNNSNTNSSGNREENGPVGASSIETPIKSGPTGV